MKFVRTIINSLIVIFVMQSCGVSGDPGHCFISIDWEYYNNNYGVYLYEDDNEYVPDLDLIEPGFYYDSYPGIYNYYYESEDEINCYSYTGTYTLIQNPGFSGGFLHDGMDGVDTYFDLFLFIYAKKGVIFEYNQGSSAETLLKPRHNFTAPLQIEHRNWEETKGDWTIRFEEERKVFEK